MITENQQQRERLISRRNTDSIKINELTKKDAKAIPKSTNAGISSSSMDDLRTVIRIGMGYTNPGNRTFTSTNPEMLRLLPVADVMVIPSPQGHPCLWYHPT